MYKRQAEKYEILQHYLRQAKEKVRWLSEGAEDAAEMDFTLDNSTALARVNQALTHYTNSMSFELFGPNQPVFGLFDAWSEAVLNNEAFESDELYPKVESIERRMQRFEDENGFDVFHPAALRKLLHGLSEKDLLDDLGGELSVGRIPPRLWHSLGGDETLVLSIHTGSLHNLMPYDHMDEFTDEDNEAFDNAIDALQEAGFVRFAAANTKAMEDTYKWWEETREEAAKTDPNLKASVMIVDANLDDDYMILWDKKIKDQPEAVQKVLMNLPGHDRNPRDRWSRRGTAGAVIRGAMDVMKDEDLSLIHI